MHRLRVRYVECDMQGIVSNSHHYTWMDIAHAEPVREVLGSLEKLFEPRTADPLDRPRRKRRRFALKDNGSVSDHPGPRAQLSSGQARCSIRAASMAQ